MHGLRKSEDETWLEWHVRSLRCTRKVFLKDFDPITIAWLHRLLSFGWRIAVDTRQCDSTRFVRACVEFRDTAWWEASKEEGERVDPDNSFKWRRVTRGKPPLRWERPFTETFGVHWIQEIARVAAQGASVRSWRPAFVQKAYECLNMSIPVYARIKQIGGAVVVEPDWKKRRIVPLNSVPWDFSLCAQGAHMQICCVGDNETMVNWWNNDAAVAGKFRSTAAAMRSLSQFFWHRGVAPCACHEGFFRHEYREENADADWLASRAISYRRSWCRFCSVPLPLLASFKFIYAKSDGGSKKGLGGGGYKVWISNETNNDGLQWTAMLEVSLYFGEADSLTAEVIASIECARAVYALTCDRRIDLDSFCFVRASIIDCASRDIARCCIGGPLFLSSSASFAGGGGCSGVHGSSSGDGSRVQERASLLIRTHGQCPSAAWTL